MAPPAPRAQHGPASGSAPSHRGLGRCGHVSRVHPQETEEPEAQASARAAPATDPSSRHPQGHQQASSAGRAPPPDAAGSEPPCCPPDSCFPDSRPQLPQAGALPASSEAPRPRCQHPTGPGEPQHKPFLCSTHTPNFPPPTVQGGKSVNRPKPAKDGGGRPERILGRGQRSDSKKDASQWPLGEGA